ncbi:radical SAM family heme chaperone HemW [Dermatobacter hominis]|uniref:radical SAM family heme chaperone HemW n=1 Tax=Dermatobacter hominis TaxID=2884263 RepID=UPI001D122373|nr:radical SAM family heme chaperone HemW [Dermatobacter hominis]UDY34385.1 radical SAM family heme chaperone HemW [Dermatobacter hominis]
MTAEATTAPALGIYLHVPFCARRCGYCAFVTYAPGELTAEQTHRRWADAAIAELAVADRELGPDRPPLTSVFLGGGTPTAVVPGLLAEVLDEVRRRFDVADDLEVSVEANPDGLADGQLDRLAEMGVTRASFGMQSAVPRVLDLLDRTHDPDAVPRAVAAARAAGIASVSLDLIHGTPGETAADWERTLDAALALAPDHLSAYALGIEPGTKLAARVRSGSLPEPSPDEAADRYEALSARAEAAGLHWYEVSNWARTADDRCRHNLLYWRDDDWWGLGPGAHSHVGDRRWWNHAGLDEWGAAAWAGRVPAAGSEVLDPSQRSMERVMLGIRLAEGLPLDVVPVPGAVAALVDDGLVDVVGDRLVLTQAGRLLADTVVRAVTIP